MMKRLGEWHLDNYLKTNPGARGIYELKEQMSSMKVEVQSFQFDMRYEIAGNTAGFSREEPLLENRESAFANEPRRVWSVDD